MSATTEPTGTLEVAMKHAQALLAAQPHLAAEQAREILKVVPNYAPAAFLLASALARAGRGDEAIAALRQTVTLNPQHPEAWRLLADHLMAVGDPAGADAAYARHLRSSSHNPALLQAAAAMVKNDLPQAEGLLKSYLYESPTDAPAMRMLAEVAVRRRRDDDAENLLVRCLELAPAFAAARHNYAQLLNRRSKSSEALIEIERLLAADPGNPAYRNLQAAILGRVGEYERSSRVYAELLREYPAHAKLWLSYGHVLRTQGHLDEAIVAYRNSIAHDPASGEAYWSLANLKTFRFEDADVSAMQVQVADESLDAHSRLHFNFALGKAFEDAGEYGSSFAHYSKGNAIQRARTNYDADQNSARIRHLKQQFTREFFRERAGSGHDAPDPIFIVGMPRAGSTLLEQILSSHPAVEGTSELPEILAMAKSLRDRTESADIASYCDAVASMHATELRELGERYIARTRMHRKTGAPLFIDKMPNNFFHVGLIQLVLPNAKIIDARRHPLACCFSNFKQHYARGQLFSYDLTDVGRFYRDYVELMAHLDEVLPGRIHRVFYEQIVEDTENQVRRLLEYCGLPFDEGCLRFYENERPVRTPSAEQVRQPIYRDGMVHWHHYESWLDPLKEALGDVLLTYPAVPKF